LTPLDVTAINVNLGKDVITGVVNTRGKFAANVNETGGQFAIVTGVIATGSGPWVMKRKEKLEMA
jgi:hypothetical protein